MKKYLNYKMAIHIVMTIICLTFIIPFVYVISASFTSENTIKELGYQLIPDKIDVTAYRFIFENPSQLIQSYKITIAFSVLGTFAAMVVMSMMAYALSRPQFRQRRIVTFFVYFTMLFSGGLIPSYIINTKYLGIGNSFWIYILPGLASAYYLLILRTFFQGISSSLIEAAKIDGAKEMTIFRVIVLPISKPALATVLLFTLLGKWNDWQTSLLYIRDEHLYSLQYLLQRILREAQFLERVSKEGSLLMNESMQQDIPQESLRFAMAILAAGPMLVVFPFFQKYFTRGLTVGSVKG